MDLQKDSPRVTQIVMGLLLRKGKEMQKGHLERPMVRPMPTGIKTQREKPTVTHLLLPRKDWLKGTKKPKVIRMRLVRSTARKMRKDFHSQKD